MTNEISKYDEPRSYKARLYKPNSGDFEVVSLAVREHHLVVESDATDGGGQYDLGEFKLELTGQDGDRIRLVHVPSGETYICTDHALLADVHMHGGQWEVSRDAVVAKEKLHRMPMRNAVIVASVIAGVILFASSFSFGLDLVIDMAMKNIPTELEDTIANYAVKDEALDHTSVEWARIDRIGQKLLGNLDQNPYKFRFFILDNDELNAFALPGGALFVTRKLVKDAKNDDELAAVIAHEIGHVIHRDSLKRILHAGGFGICIGIATGGIAGKEDVKRFIPSLEKLETLNFSRQQEAAADKLGIKLAFKAGYDPLQEIDLFERIEKLHAEQKKSVLLAKQAEAFLSDHPMTEDRIKMIRVETARLREKQKRGEDLDLTD